MLEQNNDCEPQLLSPRVHVVTSLDLGGVETQMVELAGFYADKNIAELAHFLVIGKGGESEDLIVKLGCQVHPLFWNGHSSRVRLMSEIRRTLSAIDPKVVYFHGAEPIVYGLVPSFKWRKRLLITEEIGIPNHSFKAKIVFGILHRLASATICSTEIVKSWLVLNKEVKGKNAHVVGLPVRKLKPNLARYDNPKRVIKYLYLGRFEEVKNLMALLEAIKQYVVHPDSLKAEFQLIGRGSYETQLIEFVTENHLNDSIKIQYGSFDVQSFFDSADFLIQTSISEGFGLSMVEAMCAGVPAITTPVGVASDLVNDGLNGIIIKDFSPESILNALLISSTLSQNEYKEMSHEATKSTNQLFSINTYMRKINRLEETLNAHKR